MAIVDLDEHGLIEPHLRSLPEGDLRYAIGDAAEYTEAADVLYLSGFTPDELYRLKRSARCFRDPRIAHRFRLPWWRDTWAPFHPMLNAHVRRTREIVIVQSYASAVPICAELRRAFHYYFAERDFVIDRLYANHNCPHWYLLIAVREPREFGPEITAINGRCHVIRKW